VLGQQERFLEQFAIIGNVTAAAKLTGIDRQLHYDWLDERQKYPDYEARFVAAKEAALDRIRTEIRRRGITGWNEPVYGSRVDPKTGKSLGMGVVGTKHVFSDRMLELAARIWLPECRDRDAVTRPQGSAIQAEPLSTLTDAQLEARIMLVMKVLRATSPALPPATPSSTTRVNEVEAATAAYERVFANRNGTGHDPLRRERL
jgi:hypothetical protein